MNAGISACSTPNFFWYSGILSFNVSLIQKLLIATSLVSSLRYTSVSFVRLTTAQVQKRKEGYAWHIAHTIDACNLNFLRRIEEASRRKLGCTPRILLSEHSCFVLSHYPLVRFFRKPLVDAVDFFGLVLLASLKKKLQALTDVAKIGGKK